MSPTLLTQAQRVKALVLLAVLLLAARIAPAAAPGIGVQSPLPAHRLLMVPEVGVEPTRF
jgi:hypothetical protein